MQYVCIVSKKFKADAMVVFTFWDVIAIC